MDKRKCYNNDKMAYTETWSIIGRRGGGLEGQWNWYAQMFFSNEHFPEEDVEEHSLPVRVTRKLTSTVNPQINMESEMR